jgi:Flp pilus assembly protein TadG
VPVVVEMRIHRPQAGQTAVEFALILPILVLILMGVFDFGRAFYAYSVVANAAREGARAGVYFRATADEVTAGVYSAATNARVISETARAINKYWIGLETGPTAPQVWRSPPSVTPGTISVTVSYSFRPVTPVIDAFLTNHKMTLVASSVMGLE